MTEEQGSEIIYLLKEMNDKLDRMQESMPDRQYGIKKNLNDVCDKLEDVVSAVDNVERAVDSMS